MPPLILNAVEGPFTAPCLCRDMGLVSIVNIEADMDAMANEIKRGGASETLLFMCHPPSISIGLKNKNELQPKGLLKTIEEFRSMGIPLYKSVRGGGVTYHWPGQLVCYPVIKLEGSQRNIPKYMESLEAISSETLAEFGVKAVPRRDTPAHIGLWVGGNKIVSMGVRIRDWVTMFGFAINLENLDPISRFVEPCGIPGAKFTTIERIIGQPVSREEVKNKIISNFSTIFNRRVCL